jgi:hypothetical protein
MQNGTECLPLTSAIEEITRVSHPALSKVALVTTINNNNNNNLWYEHVPKSVETSQDGKVTILWNQ